MGLLPENVPISMLQRVAPALEQRVWRVKRISGAYCTQMDLLTCIYSREVGWGGLNPPCLEGKVKSLSWPILGAQGCWAARPDARAWLFASSLMVESCFSPGPDERHRRLLAGDSRVCLPAASCADAPPAF